MVSRNFKRACTGRIKQYLLCTFSLHLKLQFATVEVKSRSYNMKDYQSRLRLAFFLAAFQTMLSWHFLHLSNPTVVMFMASAQRKNFPDAQE